VVARSSPQRWPRFRGGRSRWSRTRWWRSIVRTHDRSQGSGQAAHAHLRCPRDRYGTAQAPLSSNNVRADGCNASKCQCPANGAAVAHQAQAAKLIWYILSLRLISLRLGFMSSPPSPRLLPNTVPESPVPVIYIGRSVFRFYGGCELPSALPTSGRRRRLRWPPRCYLEALAAKPEARGARRALAGSAPGPLGRARRAGHCGPSAAGGLRAGQAAPARAGGDPQPVDSGRGRGTCPFRFCPSWIGQFALARGLFASLGSWLGQSRPGPVRSGHWQVSYVAEIQDHESRKAACQRAGSIIFIADEQATLNGTRPTGNSTAGAKPAACP
jgi:hypothetical protein